jgi:hypothetical protein
LQVVLKTRPWEEASVAPISRRLRHLARLDVLKQESWSETSRKAVDEGPAFSPWNELAAHKPLGSIMRARRLT